MDEYQVFRPRPRTVLPEPIGNPYDPLALPGYGVSPEYAPAVAGIALALMGALPGVGDAMDVVDVDRYGRMMFSELGAGEFGEAGKSAGLAALSGLGLIPIAGGIANVGKRTLANALDMSYPARMARAKEMGFLTKGDVLERIAKDLDVTPSSTYNGVALEKLKRPYPSYWKGVASKHGVDLEDLEDFNDYERFMQLDLDTPWEVYHGGAAPISKFSKKRLGTSTKAQSAKRGIFTTNLPEDANAYADWGSPRSEMVQNTTKDLLTSKQRAITNQIVDEVNIKAFDLRTDRQYRDALKQAHPELKDDIELLTELIEEKEKRFGGHDWYLHPNDMEIIPPELRDAYTDIRTLSSDIAAQDLHIQQLKQQEDALEASFLRAESRQNSLIDKFGLREKAPNVTPLHVRAQNPYMVNMEGKGFGSITKNIDEAKRLGHDGVIFFDIRDPSPGATHFFGFEPNQFRSVNAKFDPKKILSPDLMAGVGALGLVRALQGEGE